MEVVILVIHLLIAVALVGVVLLQRSEGGALGIGGNNAGGGVFSACGSANALTRMTAILAAAFMVTSIVLTIMAGATKENQSILDTIPSGSTSGTPANQDSVDKNPATNTEQGNNVPLSQ